MKKRTPISKIMTSDITTVNKTNTLKDVSAMFDNGGFHHVPVVSGDSVIGMISKTDLQKISFVNGIDEKKTTTAMYDVLSLEQVMTKDLSTVQKDDTIYDVAVLLSNNEFHALPVLEGKKLVGIVTSTDLMKYLVDQF